MALGRITVPWRTLRRCTGTMTRSTVLGFVAGVLPGAGASLGSFISYTVEKRISDRAGTFGTGDPRGVAAPEAGNNAAAGGALVPMLTLGVPGSGTTAVLLALLMTLNITPGPLLFEQRPDLVWGLIAALVLGNLMLLVMNIPLVGLFVRLLSVPPYILMPAVAMVSFVGIYAISGSVFDLLLMIAFGVLGYLARKLDIPTVPIILGILLGNQMENNLRRALTISNGDWTVLWGSPLAIGLWTAAVVGFLAPLLLGRFVRPPTSAEAEPD
jgi:putative tricarboxylic transport membrane protein